MKKKFTLIELIVVIAVLGILAVIVIPNIANMKEKTIKTAVIADTRVLQTASDMYQIDNNSSLPTVAPPTKELPQAVDFAKVYPEQLRNLPKIDGVKYWMDVNGTVWSSFEDMPQGFKYDSTTGDLSWNKVDSAKGYEIQEVVKSDATSDLKRSVVKYKTVKKVMDVGAVTFKGEANKAYAISSIDKYGFPSAPIGTGVGYESGYQDTLESIKKGQSGQTGSNPTNPDNPTNPATPITLDNVTYSIVEETGIVNVLGKTDPNADVKLTFPDGQTVSGKSNTDGTFSIPSTKSVDTDGKIGVVATTSSGATKTVEISYVSNKIANAVYTWERKQVASKAVYRAVPLWPTPSANPMKYPTIKSGNQVTFYQTISKGTFEPFAPETTDTVYVAGSGEDYSVSKQNFDSPNWDGMNVHDQVKYNTEIYNFTSSNTITTVLPKRLADIVYQSYVDTYNGYTSPFEEGKLYLFITYHSQFEYNMKSRLIVKKLELVNPISEQEEFKDVVVSKDKSAYPADGIGKDGYHYTLKQTVDSTKYFETGGVPLDSFIRMNVRPSQIGTNTPITIDFNHPGSKNTSNAKYDNYEYKLDGNPIALSFSGTYRLQYPSLPAGEHVISTRLHQANGGWSEWVNKTFVVQDKVVEKPQVSVKGVEVSSKMLDGRDGSSFTNLASFNIKNARYVRILGQKEGTSQYELVSQLGLNNPYANGADPDYGYGSKYTSDGILTIPFTNVQSSKNHKIIAYDESGTIMSEDTFLVTGKDSIGSKTPSTSVRLNLSHTFDANSVTLTMSRPTPTTYYNNADIRLYEIVTRSDGTTYSSYIASKSGNATKVEVDKPILFTGLTSNKNYRIDVVTEWSTSSVYAKDTQYIYFKTP